MGGSGVEVWNVTFLEAAADVRRLRSNAVIRTVDIGGGWKLHVSWDASSGSVRSRMVDVKDQQVGGVGIL